MGTVRRHVLGSMEYGYGGRNGSISAIGTERTSSIGWQGGET